MVRRWTSKGFADDSAAAVIFRTYLSFKDFLKISMCLKWPLGGLSLELRDQIIHVTGLTLN